MTGKICCRGCAAPLGRTIIDLGETPLANSYLPPEPSAVAMEQRWPLHVRLCERCLLAQVEATAPPEAIFSEDYAYFSSFSASWVAHAERFVEGAVERFKLGAQSLVVEVASNDGYLLQHVVKRGVGALGVEPAAGCAAAAAAKGVETRVAFFNRETAKELVAEDRAADLTVANNVLAHVPDMNSFLAGFATVLKPGGVAVFEFPHLLRMLEDAQFDTIYHEHYFYLSLIAVERAFARVGLRAFDVEKLSTHGGSLRLFACREEAEHRPTPAIAALRAEEKAAGLDTPEGYGGLTERAEAIRAGFRAWLSYARAQGRKIAAYGAAAKGNTFLNYCGVTCDDIAFVVDRNPAKQGTLLPGSHVPVKGPEALRASMPDAVVILPWNLADEIAAEHAYISEWGGKFVVATPSLRELTPQERTADAAA